MLRMKGLFSHTMSVHTDYPLCTPGCLPCGKKISLRMKSWPFFPTCGLTSFLICPDSLPVLTVHLHFLPRYSQRNLLNSEIAGEKNICRQISISTAIPPTACFTSSQYFSGLRKVLFCSFQSYIIEHMKLKIFQLTSYVQCWELQADNKSKQPNKKQ